jgi:hypothetical protein
MKPVYLNARLYELIPDPMTAIRVNRSRRGIKKITPANREAMNKIIDDLYSVLIKKVPETSGGKYHSNNDRKDY